MLRRNQNEAQGSYSQLTGPHVERQRSLGELAQPHRCAVAPVVAFQAQGQAT
jgi:hypothetical protein